MHPQTIARFLDAIDKETDNKVIQELICALGFICNRHLPDLPTLPYFIQALDNKNATIRWLGIMGLEGVYYYPHDQILNMTEDKSEKVREKSKVVLQNRTIEKRTFPSWMFNEE